MKPVCVPCQRFYRPKKNGFKFIEGMPLGNDVLPGKIHDNKWHPYKLWCGDLWECPDCKHQTISGVGWQPMGEHYQKNFSAQVKAAGATFKVNDC